MATQWPLKHAPQVRGAVWGCSHVSHLLWAEDLFSLQNISMVVISNLKVAFDFDKNGFLNGIDLVNISQNYDMRWHDVIVFITRFMPTVFFNCLSYSLHCSWQYCDSGWWRLSQLVDTWHCCNSRGHIIIPTMHITISVDTRSNKQNWSY